MAFTRASDGARLHYEAFGRRDRPAVLMIQGLGADKHGWDMQRFALAPNYRVIAFDNRGAGRSDKPFGPYSLEQMADDAIAVLDHAGVDSAHVVGASMGGAISQLMCRRAPRRVRSLVDARVHRLPQPAVATRAAGRWMQTVATERGHGRDDQRGSPLGDRRLARSVALCQRFGWLGPLAMRSAGAFVRRPGSSHPGGRRRHSPSSYDNVHVPTLVIVGNQDILTPRGDSEEIADRIPGAELVVISGAAHGFMVEHASTFNRVLLEFLARASVSYAAETTPTSYRSTPPPDRLVPSAS